MQVSLLSQGEGQFDPGPLLRTPLEAAGHHVGGPAPADHAPGLLIIKILFIIIMTYVYYYLTCVWYFLWSGSAGSLQVAPDQGSSSSADCSAPYPPVIRIVSVMKKDEYS